MDRQEAISINGIERSHVRRYEFAKHYVRGDVLDAACGVGYGSKLLGATGVDIDPPTIDKARTFYSGDYIRGDIEAKPWNGKFDVIVSFETLEHLKNPSLAVSHFRDSLNEGGLFIGSVPNENVTPFRSATFANHKYPHLRHYTPEQVEDLLMEFEIIERWTQVSKKHPEVIKGWHGMNLIWVAKC